MNTPSALTPEQKEAKRQEVLAERRKNEALYPWFSEIVNRYPRGDVKAAWIRETDDNDNDTGVILAGRVLSDEYKYYDMDADLYLKLADDAKYLALPQKEKNELAKLHLAKYGGNKKVNRKSARKGRYR